MLNQVISELELHPQLLQSATSPYGQPGHLLPFSVFCATRPNVILLDRRNQSLKSLFSIPGNCWRMDHQTNCLVLSIERKKAMSRLTRFLIGHTYGQTIRSAGGIVGCDA
jgi:hypothetical protein